MKLVEFEVANKKPQKKSKNFLIDKLSGIIKK